MTAAARALYERLLTTWNERDAQRMSALFQPDGTLIGFDGSRIAGGNDATRPGSTRTSPQRRPDVHRRRTGR
ncbi:SgcJ/EcaC family oxidoreductase [Cryptosporangium sp. NPDC048952]|uniref:SgcJ/EcaC family oxidoreductase n=1 Tax=Cryptosporangium sp. NPDC048952 TaxID=3363961 RepID=UPI00371E0174